MAIEAADIGGPYQGSLVPSGTCSNAVGQVVAAVAPVREQLGVVRPRAFLGGRVDEPRPSVPGSP